MAKKIAQIKVTETNKNVLESYGPVTKMGIQGKVGATTFSINGGNPITIPMYGIYEVDLTGTGGIIQSLVFTACDSNATYVDIIYEGGK